MEVTCWCCGAIFDPEATGKRCPNCGRHSEAWLARLRFSASDFIGPVAVLGMGLYNLRDNPGISVLFILSSVVWAGYIHLQDGGDWVKPRAPDLNLGEPRRVAENAPLSKPPMPDSWKRLASVPCPRQLESASEYVTKDAPSQGSLVRRATSLTWLEQLLLAAVICGSIIYVVLRWSWIEDFVLHGRISLAALIYPAVILCLVAYAVRRSRFDDQVLRDGVLTTGVLTGWYESSSLKRSSYVRIRYQFWTESGQKFEGSGTLTPGFSGTGLSLEQEPLKVFYLPHDPSKSVSLCCTTSRVRLD